MRRRWKMGTVAIALAALICALYQLSWWTSRAGGQTPLYSTQRFDGYGTAALMELLQTRGVDVKTLERPRLPTTDHATLIRVLPAPSSLARPKRRRDDDDDDDDDEYRHSSDEPLSTERLVAWMKRGNTVIQLSRGHTALETQLDVPYLPTRGTKTRDAVQADERAGVLPEDLGGDWLRASWVGGGKSGQLELMEPAIYDDVGKDWKPLAGAGHVVYAGERRVGKGRLIVIGAPTPALNMGLMRGSNVELMLGLIGDGPVLIDEWSHGIGHGGTILQLMTAAGLGPVLLQIIVVLGLYHWSTRGYRRVEREHGPRRRSSLEQVQTLGYLYQRSLPPAEERRRVTGEVHRRLAEAMRCPVAQLTERAAKLSESSATEFRDILALAAASAKDPPHKRNSARLAQLLTRSHTFVEDLKREH